MRYKAFISYSHGADGKLAPAVQHALHRIAKPWYGLRSMRVFRDQTNLAASPGLWSSIESALREAEFFLYLASPTAAKSPWVEKEVDWWLKNRSCQSFLILLTEGDIVWNDAKKDFDWSATTALPRQVANAFAEEPLYTDIRWARTMDQLSARHTQFRSAILDLAATLLNRSKDELDGDDVRQHRRTKRIAYSGVIALLALLVAALLAAYFATQQSMLASSRALGAQSEALLPTNPELAMLLAREALRFKSDEQAEYSLRQAFLRNPWRMIHHTSSGKTVVAKFVGSDMVVAAEPGKPAVVWNVATGQRITELPGDVGDQLTLNDSADHSLVAVPADETTFTVYDAKTWKPVSTLPGAGARFSRDGQVLTASDGEKVRQWSVPSLQERKVTAASPAGYGVRDVSKDGSLLFLAEEGEVSSAVIVQAASGQTLARLPNRVLREGSGFSPDDRFVVTERMDDSGIELWDTQTGSLIKTLEKVDDLGWTTYVAFSPDGKIFVSGNRNGDLHVWNVQTGKWFTTERTHRNDILWIKFSPDGGTMLSAAADGTACLWDTASMRCLVQLGGKGDDAWDIAFASDNRHFLTTHQDGTVRVWDRQVWYPNLTIPAEKAVLSDEGSLVLGTSRTGPIRLWEAETGKVKTTLEGSSGDVESIALNVPASLIAIARAKGVVGLWSAQTGKRTMQLSAESTETTALAFNSAGTRLATGSNDGKVRFWSTRDGSLLSVWQASKERVTAIVFHPDGERVAVATWEEWARMRDIKSGAILLEAKLDEEGAVAEALALSANGNLLLVTGDKFPQVWDLNSRARVQTLAGHTDEVYSGAFSGDARWILTGSGYRHARGEPPEDGNAVYVWDARSGRQLLSYRSAGLPVGTVYFANNGTRIFASSEDGTVRRYECEVCSPLPALLDLVSSRTARELTADERARYVPKSTLLGWLASR
jgi:WD40 repeat protein